MYSYDEIMTMCERIKPSVRREISLEEIYYVAILTNAGLTGQERSTQHCKVFPNRMPQTVKNIKTHAKRMKLVR